MRFLDDQFYYWGDLDAHIQLMIIECKTGDNAFKSDTFYKLDSVSGPLGGHFVSKMLVTSLPVPDEKDSNKLKKYKDFLKRVEERGIVVITREGLSTVGREIENLAKHPKRARI